MLKRLGVSAWQRWRHALCAVSVLIVVFFSAAAPASDSIPADCDTALGDFIFAQRVAQDVCGREGRSGDIVQPAQRAQE